MKLFVNDGSTDNSEKILEQFNKNIQHISIKNSGPGVRNLAIQKQRNNIYFLLIVMTMQKKTLYKE